jgi:FixJ family two-component response regulator
MTTVYIVDDDVAVRQSLALLVRSVGLQAASFESGTAFLAAFTPEMSGCLVVDIRMPGLSGLDLQQALRERNCQLPIVFVTGHADVSMAVRAMRAGAIDFIEKPFRDQELLDRINQALALNQAWRTAQTEIAEIRALLASLTPREHEVMARIVQGQANKVIALDLGLSERTVEIHRAKVMTKTGAHSLAELVSLVAKVR